MSVAETKVCQHPFTDAANICTDCCSFVMPKIEQGSDVAYYDHSLNASRKTVAFVTKVSNTRRSVTVFVPSTGQTMELVRHISDPKLKDAPEHRENGAWDYSDRTKAMQEELSELIRRVEKLEQKAKAKKDE